jgi:predicted nucleic acid-binding protein
MAFQEVLAGAQTDEGFSRLERDIRLSAQILVATEEDHALAGQLSSFCRRRGGTTGAPDALIVAQALSLGASIFAEDQDYTHIQAVYPLLRLHRIGDVPEEVVVKS